MEKPIPEPFKTLGTHLKYLREQLQESLAEVSGAVEIEEKTLELIEAGVERPAEDILLLLINHFNIQDQEAVQLWELAGYDGEVPKHVRPPELGITPGKGTLMLLAIDTRTMYSDDVEINSSQAGLTLTFSQTGLQKQPQPVARVGMSYEQAEAVIRALEQAILKGKYLRGPKQLPPEAQ